MNAIPWTYEERPDTRITNVHLGMWLFLASEAMFFGSLLSGYVLLRAGAADWPDASAILDLRLAVLNTALLLAASAVLVTRGFGVGKLLLSAALGATFVVVKGLEYRAKIEAGLIPSTSVFLACWFTLTGVHALHVGAGVVVNLWLASRARAMGSLQALERLRATRLYWLFVDAVWIAILVGCYFV